MMEGWPCFSHEQEEEPAAQHPCHAVWHTALCNDGKVLLPLPLLLLLLLSQPLQLTDAVVQKQ
jgi:hypothetical protein